ncbi:MAG: F0F1 ATP synthase subunit B [Gemmatimonadota bacterium]
MRRPGLAALLAGATLLIPSALPAAEQDAGIFSVNLGLVVWTWVLFLLTLLVLAWKVFPAIAKGLEARHDRIHGEIESARREREEAQRLLEEHRAQFEQARREAQDLLQEGRTAGEKLREEILARAREEHEGLLERARREIASEREEMMEILRRETVDLSLAAAEHLLRERLDDETSRRLVRDYVAELE